MTDNHWGYTKSAKLAQLLERHRITHTTVKPHCPWQKGLVQLPTRADRAELA